MPEYIEYISGLINQKRRHGPVVFLDSQKKDHPASTKSYLAAQPNAWIKSHGDELIIWDGKEVRKTRGNPWVALSEFTQQHKDWLFGYLGYDLKNYIEDLDSKNPAISSAPDMFFMVPGLLVEITNQEEIRVLKGILTDYIVPEVPTDEIFVEPKISIDKQEYLKKIEKAQRHIAEGDFYEINVSHALEFTFEGDEFQLYKKMRALGPVPFASFIQIDGVTVCSSSPERFLSRKGNKVWSQPIKGTLSRNGKDDEKHREELLNSEKNRAENLMIVDLVRNDLSRIAKKGSVKVKNLFEVQSFETVHQLVSTVQCEVESDQNSVEIIKACFPMGSMTGAPKISAMKAIETLEDYKRGIYSGAIGYITPEQGFDFNVVIRTAIIEKGKLVFPVGGAITSDSIPEEEWEETLVKSKALTIAID
ncbi:MAG: aminodeoxychorismate synthase component I [Balneola sp.]